MLDRPVEDAKKSVLQSAFGYHDFRPGQEAVIDSVLSGRSALAVMPTGAGKSLCYQVPALVLGGLTIVVSPLIALMDDQVAALRMAGVGAEAIHSGRDREDNVASWRRVASGEARLLYLAPERLMSERMLAALSRLPVRLIAVDEAHCISQWGHSFRSEYLGLGRLREVFAGISVLALTATADAATRNDVVERLFAGRADIFVSGFDRPNLSIAVADKKRADEQILDFVRARAGASGIVYRLSRRKVEETAARLEAAGMRALPYHAGMDAAKRAANQEAFLAENGIVMVATIAFGMGIDKSDVRYVLHGDIPGSLEAYYQEIGRAGRDGAPAETLLLYGPGDVATRRRFIDDEASEPERKRVEARRLDALVGFCEATTCRRQTLLAYFGENTEPCGNCDVCLDPPQLVDGTAEARLALSLVADTGERFGAAHIVRLLRGEDSEAVTNRGHDRLPGFGGGADRPATAWRTILRQLVASAALTSDTAAYGALSLTARGRDILNGAATFSLRPAAPARSRLSRTIARTLPANVDEALLARLKDLRRRLAAERGVPAYIVFPDRTLEEMAAVHPTSRAQLAGIRGVGEAKLAAFADDFLALLNE